MKENLKWDVIRSQTKTLVIPYERESEMGCHQVTDQNTCDSL